MVDIMIEALWTSSTEPSESYTVWIDSDVG